MTTQPDWAPAKGRSRARIAILGTAASAVLIGIGVAAAFRDFVVWPVPLIVGIIGVLIWGVGVPVSHRRGRL